MLVQRLPLLHVGVVLWLVSASFSCHSAKGRQELMDSYGLARFRLTECQDMGAGHLDPDSLDMAMRLSKGIEETLAAERWSEVGNNLARLQEIIDLIRERLQSWDPDKDGLSNYAEFMLYGTLWDSRDSDGDGYLDSSEILQYQTDPLDHCSIPLTAPLEVPLRRDCAALEKFRGGT
jgi:hypothetical protein